MNNFFKDLKIIELASVLAGPAVGMFFAELGAEVIKIENARTGGDVTRQWKMPGEDAGSPNSAYFFSVNWGKKHMLLDLRKKEDFIWVKNMIGEADMVISNFKSGSAKKLGLDYESLRKTNPRLIYGSISAYGKDDPRPGFDAAMQAETGWIYMNGEPDGNPCKLPVALMDILAAHQLKEGMLLALLQLARTGEGCEVTVSLYDAAIASLANQASNWLNLGHVPKRMGSLHPNIAPYGEILFSKDNMPLLLSTGTAAHFKLLCKCLDAHELIDDIRFKSNAGRLKNRDELKNILSGYFSKYTGGELLKRFKLNSVPVVPIRNLGEVFAAPEANDLVLNEDMEGGQKSKRVKTVVFKIETPMHL